MSRTNPLDLQLHVAIMPGDAHQVADLDAAWQTAQ
ncbi:hypothetical protein ACVWZX_005363 [Deinococcus sp. UYEF24]